VLVRVDVPVSVLDPVGEGVVVREVDTDGDIVVVCIAVDVPLQVEVEVSDLVDITEVVADELDASDCVALIVDVTVDDIELVPVTVAL